MDSLAAGEKSDDQPVEGVQRVPGTRVSATAPAGASCSTTTRAPGSTRTTSVGSSAGSAAAPMLAVPIPGTVRRGTYRNPLITSFISELLGEAEVPVRSTAASRFSCVSRTTMRPANSGRPRRIHPDGSSTAVMDATSDEHRTARSRRSIAWTPLWSG